MTRIFSSALFAGLAAGLIAAALQFAFITPLILEAEAYETGELVHFGAVAHLEDAATTETAHHHEAAEEGAGMSRHLLTVAMNLVTWTGFALALIGLVALSGRDMNPQQGVLWGLGGFAATQLLPALGLSPELPGTPAEDVVLRQYWWMATVAASALGLGLIFLVRKPVYVVLGLVLLAVPHIIGAPELDYFGGVAPPELAGKFCARSLGVGAVTWVTLGFVLGWVWEHNPLAARREATA